jgi:hypothetical protein
VSDALFYTVPERIDLCHRGNDAALSKRRHLSGVPVQYKYGGTNWGLFPGSQTVGDHFQSYNAIRDLLPNYGSGLISMITRRHFIRNGSIAAASFLAGQSRAWVDGATNDLLASRVLLVYNTSSKDGLAVADYYKANRPGMLGVDTLAVTADTTEQTTSANMISQIRTPIYDFIANSPHPKYYVIMCRGLSSRVWDSGLPIASVDYLIGRSDHNLANSVGAEYHQGGGVNYYNTSFAPGSYAGTPILVTRMDMGSLSTTKAYIQKIKTMYDAMPSPSVIVSANSARLGGSNYLMDEVRNPAYSLFFPISKNYSDLANASYSNVPLARRLYIFGTAGTNAHLTSGADVTGYESWGVNGGMSSTYPNNRSLFFTGKSNWYLVKTFESYNGIIGSDHGNFEQWFSPTTGSGWHYSRTPIGMACHTDEPSISGVEGSMYMCNWEAGLLFSECAWSSRKTKYFMAVGDPLVKR